MLFLVKPHLENSSKPGPGMGELGVAPPSAGLDDLRAHASLQAGKPAWDSLHRPFGCCRQRRPQTGSAAAWRPQGPHEASGAGAQV